MLSKINFCGRETLLTQPAKENAKKVLNEYRAYSEPILNAQKKKKKTIEPSKSMVNNEGFFPETTPIEIKNINPKQESQIFDIYG